MEDLVDRIYEAAVLPELWPDVLSRIGTLTNTAGGILFVNSPHGTRFTSSVNLSDAMNCFIREGWMALDRNPRAASVVAERYPGFLNDIDTLSQEQMQKTPMYTQFLHP